MFRHLFLVLVGLVCAILGIEYYRSKKNKNSLKNQLKNDYDTAKKKVVDAGKEFKSMVEKDLEKINAKKEGSE